jgi:hypothetical protein
MRQPAARLKGLKGSVYALQDPATGQYIALHGAAPKLAPLHLATLAPASADCLAKLEQLASQKLAGSTPHELVRVDAP